MGIQRLRLEATELTEEHRGLLEVMADSVRRTDGIVGGLLRYSRPSPLFQRPLRLDRIVGDALTLLRDSFENAGIAVDHRIHFDGEVMADPDQIRQVIDNLLKNALEAQPTGGFVVIEITGDDDSAQVSVTNGGFDLSPTDTERVLEPYFTTKTRGTGLGLAISEKIVRAHGGALTVAVPDPGKICIAARLPNNEKATAEG